MANKNKTGFYPVSTLTGAEWTASVRRFPANTVVSNVCVGSLVQMSVDGTVEVVTGASSNIIGAVVGIEPVAKTTTSVQGSSLSLERIYVPKGTTGVNVRVVTDPFCVYETVTGNGTVIGTSNIGEQYNVLSTAGGRQAPTTTPVDPAVLDAGNPQINASAQLVLLDIGYKPGEDASNTTYANTNTSVYVVVNSSWLKAGKATPA